MAADKESLLFLENVYKEYNDNMVLDDIDFSLTEDEFCTVVGPSGCGKSTLLRLILGQEIPTSGKIHSLGEPIGFADTRRGVVYQKYSLYPHLSVIDNVSLGKRLGLGLIKSKRKVEAILDESFEFLRRMGLEEHAYKYPYELSGGMQQRVAIAQALIMRPRILLMDEPFGALDPGMRELMQTFILEIWENSPMTVLFVTHDLEEALFLGTRIIVLSKFYSDGRSYDAERGARIVADYKIKDKASTTAAKESANFGMLIAKIRREGFDPAYRKNVNDFDLHHPDSFQTLSDIEKQR
jgi:NitT/TauT family transport system ATP-binding protein